MLCMGVYSILLYFCDRNCIIYGRTVLECTGQNCCNVMNKNLEQQGALVYEKQ